MSVTINGTNGLTFNDNTTQATSPFTGGLGFRNRIINGDMRIDQRNNGASVTFDASNKFPVDRFYGFSNVGTTTAQRSSVAPTDFTNSLLITQTAGGSVTATSYLAINHKVEGFNAADFSWGSASAKTITLSFWVRSSVTGTFSVSLINSAANRSYVATYTINAANTWEQKTITIAGDTSGTWLTDNGVGIWLVWNLGYGSNYTSSTTNSWIGSAAYGASTATTSFANTTGATFYITGVQLEKGSTATSFDYRPYGTELALCQRYCVRLNDPSQTYGIITTGTAHAATDFYATLPFTLRASPTITYANLQLATAATAKTISAISTNANSNGTVTLLVTSSALTGGQAGILQQNNSTSGYLQLSSEL